MKDHSAPMRKKILFIDSPLVPAQGGGQKSLLLLMRGLPAADYAVSVAVPEGPESDFCRDARAAGLALHKVAVSFRAVRALLRAQAPDLVHCNSATTRLTFLAALNARLSGTPFVWHVRVMEQAGWKDRVIAGLSGRIIAISGAVARRFAHSPAKVRKVYNAVDTAVFAPGPGSGDLRGELGIAAGAKVVGVIGRLVELKGHRTFLRMAGKIGEKAGRCVFLVVGAGEEAYTRELKEYSSQLDLEDSVIFTGHREDIPALISLCDVVAAPSDGLEAFGRVLIEAMACGKPVVAGDAGGMPEIVENDVDGFLVPCRDADAYAAAVLALLADPARAAEMGRNGLKKARRFSVAEHVSGVEKVYAELIG